MSKNYEIETSSIRKGDFLDNFIMGASMGLVDTAKHEEVTTVTDKNTGSTVTFDNKDDAMDYVSKNLK
jgi:hypothetical protein